MGQGNNNAIAFTKLLLNIASAFLKQLLKMYFFHSLCSIMSLSYPYNVFPHVHDLLWTSLLPHILVSSARHWRMPVTMPARTSTVRQSCWLTCNTSTLSSSMVSALRAIHSSWSLSTWSMEILTSSSGKSNMYCAGELEVDNEGRQLLVLNAKLTPVT